jgi:hypothetical protein
MKTRYLLTALLLFAMLPSAALADTVILPAAKDNTIYEDTFGQYSNGQGIYLYTGKTGTELLRRALIAFDLSSIPANATVTGAILTLRANRTGPEIPGDISLRKVLADWGEGASDAGTPGGNGAESALGDATWIHTFFDTAFWTTPGGDFSSTASASTAVDQPGDYTWSGSGLVADVQAWVSNPATNFGWAIIGNEVTPAGAVRFGSRENSTTPPHLDVTYIVTGPTPTPGPTATPTATGTATPIPTATATPSPTPTPSPAQALNISTRMRVETGNNVLIAGFIITGNATKRVAIRGIGPSLTAFGVNDALADPTIELRESDGSVIFENDNWQDSPQAAQLVSLGLAPTHPKESGLVIALQPGNYTAILAGKNQGTGVGVGEVFDTSSGLNSQLANISTRGFVLTGENVMIGGFILGGSSNNTRVVLRGIGPSLAQFGLSPVLADPVLELHTSNGATLVSNDDWQDDPVSAAQLTAANLAPSDPKESGIFTSLPPGQFTAILVGKNGGTGIALVELYNLR